MPYVVATAGHVDHGKSTLVRALTGIEPDRWAEERRRGLTIDLGFAWTTLPSGREVAFVDVPGHERFLGNMLAGLGPAPVVCFVVAADEGWQTQSTDHRDAVAALGIQHGLVVISRADRAPDRVGDTLAQARAELADTGLRDAPAVVVSAVDGTGLPELRAALDDVLAAVPPPSATARVRLWVDRSFTITGAGTVMTGTLAAGTVADGDRLALNGRDVVIRGLQSRGESSATLGPVTRAALNLRGVSAEEVHRGDVLLTPGAWETTRTFDVRRVSGVAFTEIPEQLTAHVGTATVQARLRPFDDAHARLVMDRELPLVHGDRLVLRQPGGRVLGGAQVLDADPPPLRRRGDSARRREALAAMSTHGDVLGEVARRGAVTVEHLRRLGFDTSEPLAGVQASHGWWIHAATYAAWQQRLRTAVQDLHDRDPLAAGLSRGAVSDLLALPDAALLDDISRSAGIEQAGGLFRLPGRSADLGPAEAAITELAKRLQDNPFHAPEAEDLAARRLGARELAAAERVGRLLRIGDGVVLLPTAPALAMRELSRLAQPFTTSEARQALGTTRRVAIPLLEHLDSRGWTRRLDAGHREVVRR
ncbi:selenocysteine-specific translation elongation factor [Mycobacterium sp. CBMA293]|uniref:selenocysteine-specific translation elongation factor n=2 Tax=Mycolicibacterium TaxID=1866885 RepID=UPI00132C9721|nr:MULTISPECIES: selenocysteine-specific translation elongation factor [unclassified Mycolicibacterium]MUL46225.1 selenocysteine-specific translation elongation factor [Mycolicibacterium sp. CBMA 360]MUL94082.1 selenocysteine-specific translation elongation factor [Mycolicibacterium sp. CBMA 230]MUL58724.1 selenocysteine-specific translation elongation factor [Mycolicibacterium sp. CBMA 335]MUL69118.1 selenocysteine-specific translation elongation factor [Mycolicibacterium sp. CBMA 311]MUM0509